MNITANEFVMKVTEILWFPPVLLNSRTPAAKQSYRSANYSSIPSSHIPLKKNHAYQLIFPHAQLNIVYFGAIVWDCDCVSSGTIPQRRGGQNLFNYERSLRHYQAVEWKSEDELTHSLNVIDYVTSPCFLVLSSLFFCWWDQLTFLSPAS